MTVMCGRPGLAADVDRRIRLVEIFTNGSCWMLAKTLHERFGLTIGIIADSAQVYSGDLSEADFDWCHMVNVLDDGQVVDITGVWGENELVEEWERINGRGSHNLYDPNEDGYTLWLVGSFMDVMSGCDCDPFVSHPDYSSEALEEAVGVVARSLGLPQ